MQHFGIARPLDLHILVTIKGLIIYIVYTDDYTGFLREGSLFKLFPGAPVTFSMSLKLFFGGGG